MGACTSRALKSHLFVLYRHGEYERELAIFMTEIKRLHNEATLASKLLPQLPKPVPNGPNLPDADAEKEK